MSDPIISPGVRGYLNGQAEAAERIADLERQLAEAQAHVRNHHIEACVSCAATESERDAWTETAAQHCRNEEYYRGLVVQIGQLFGPAAMTSDDGAVQDHVLCAKVPELVAALNATLEQARGLIQRLQFAVGMSERSIWPMLFCRGCGRVIGQDHAKDCYVETALAALGTGNKPQMPLQQGVDAIIPPRRQVIKGVEDAGKGAGG